MKKFKKPLLINVPEDDNHEAKSPSRIGVKENKQKSLLLFNQHTISSVNNEDDFHEQEDKGIHGCEEFNEYHSKEIYVKKTGFSTKQTQQVNSNKMQRNKKFNIIQFEQFMVQGGQKSKLTQTGPVDQKQRRLLHNYHKRQFSIQIPQQQKQQAQQQQRPSQMSMKFAFDLKNNQVVQKGSKVVKQNVKNVMKQPPAPSNKSSQGKSLSRRFVFPTNDQEEIMLHKNNLDLVNTNNTNNSNNTKDSKQQQQTKMSSIPQQEHQSIIIQLHIEYKQKVQQMNKSFQKQRQQFYKEKSRFQKDLMIKDGQIEMLQRLITNRYSPTNSGNSHQNQQQIPMNNNNYGGNHTDINTNPKRQSMSQSISIEKSKLLYVSDQKITAMETLLLQKDLQINSLLQKVNQLNSLIDQKNNQLEEVQIGLMRSQKMNQSLRNQIFIHQKKQQSQQLTKQFYKVKQTLIQVQKSTKTPKAAQSRPKWQQDESIQRDRQLQKTDYPFRGIDDLHKRLESLKMNRIQLQSRGRIKSQINYPQTSKNKTKGTFDFKGKFYERERDYNLRGGPY